MKSYKIIDKEFNIIKYINNKGQLHNENGPAVIHPPNNTLIKHVEYWINGKLHRKDGPAVIRKDIRDDIIDKYWHTYSCKLYYKHGKLHNLNGPAHIDIFGRETYWINGIKYTEEKWKKEKDKK